MQEQFNLQPDISLILESLRLSEERAVAGMLALEVMHEVRNPLEAIANLIYLADLQAELPNKVHEYMALVHEQIVLLAEISQQTLGFAKSTLELQPVKLSKVAEAALRIHQRMIEQKRLHLIKDLDPDAAAPVHRGAMLQVISNLLVNAVDALSAEGTLCVRLRKTGSRIQLSIADNGPGIPPENTDKVFHPFFTTKEGAGTGLGLPLSKKIIERHSGRIHMRSSTFPGRCGTIFRIVLPSA